MVRILFTSAGRRVELTRCFRRAAEKLGLRAEIHACDLEPELSAACLEAEAAFQVPRCTAPDYVERLLDHCAREKIDLLVPTIDTELDVLSRARELFAELGTMVHVSAPGVIDVVRDKERTIAVLAEAGVPVPRTARIEDLRADPAGWNFPLFAKPVGGSASRGIGVLRSAAEIRADYPEPMLVQELLRGPEYTINMYLDARGRMRSAIPHLRISTRAGEVEKGRTVRDPRMIAIAGQIAAALGREGAAEGVLCFQLIDDPDAGPRVFEINARFGGGYPLADHAGGRFAESLLARVAGLSECASDHWREGVTMVRYDSAVFRG
ncbi:ATP-grasp domain-containing protein [Novosphingobium sp. TCA1]|uniref:ATP-grasp domain-containing protein n=1 Tax=Novosphingobium sp. TCA1 TaxID=2682474 RepID=UPI001F33DBA6|nr:ATP-grasp domain-containing protein [Novosphingobium sp. TCA1]